MILLHCERKLGAPERHCLEPSGDHARWEPAGARRVRSSGGLPRLGGGHGRIGRRASPAWAVVRNCPGPLLACAVVSGGVLGVCLILVLVRSGHGSYGFLFVRFLDILLRLCCAVAKTDHGCRVMLSGFRLVIDAMSLERGQQLCHLNLCKARFSRLLGEITKLCCFLGDCLSSKVVTCPGIIGCRSGHCLLRCCG